MTAPRARVRRAATVLTPTTLVGLIGLVGVVGVVGVAPAASAGAVADRDAAGVPVATDEVRVAVLEEGADGLVVRTVDVDDAREAAVVVAQERRDPDVVAVEVDSRVQTAAGDPYRAQQWGLTDLRAPVVWASQSATGQVVAVVDTGVDARHPDLRGVVAPGRDFVGTGDGRVDPEGHGTHVAGIVAALVGNGTGGSGLARGATVLPVRVLDRYGNGWNSDVAAGIVWAADNGADVVNLSLGGPQASSLVTSAVAYAQQQDVVVVAAAGNEYRYGNPVSYPAANTGVIGVGATTSRRSAASFSQRGAWVDVVAPGVHVLSTSRGSGYEVHSGTSQAAPFVSAAAALLRAREPQLSEDEVEQRLLSTAVDLGVAGRDDTYGHGLVDPARALGVTDVASPLPPVGTMRIHAPASPVLQGSDATFTATWAGRPADDGSVARLQVQAGGTWTTVATSRVEAGRTSATVRVARPGSYRWLVGTASATTTVVVTPVVQLTRSVSSTGVVTAAGKVFPGGRYTVSLQRHDGTAWRSVRSVATTDGSFTLGHDAPRGASTYRVVVAPTSLTAPTATGTWSVRR